MGVYAIGLIGHVGGGKTSLGDAILFASGKVSKLGSVAEGTSILDHDADTRARQTSLRSSLAYCDWKSQQIELLDTPGSANFVGGAAAASRVIDGALLVATAEPGIVSQMDYFQELLDAQGVPRLMVINQLDREQANFANRLAALNNELGERFVAMQLPWGQGDSFKGVVDLLEQKAYDYSGGKPKQADIPAEMADDVELARNTLIERAAEGDDELLEKYLETESLDEEELRRGLQLGTRAGRIVPVLCSAATGNVGTDRILDAVVELLPDAEAQAVFRRGNEPDPEGYVGDHMENSECAAQVFLTRLDHYAGKLSIVRVRSGTLKAGEELFNPGANTTERPAHVFKLTGKEQTEVKELRTGEFAALPKLASVVTGHTLCSPKKKVEYQPIRFPDPVLTYALQLSGKGEEEKLSQALHRMMEEDNTLNFHHNAETGDFLVSGMGQMHLDTVLDRLNGEYSLGASFDLPHVPYRETIRAGSKAQGKYKKQTGGRGQYGDCWLELKPNGDAADLAFQSAIVGGAIPRNFIPAIEKGIQESMSKGVVAGFPVIGIDATVYDGSFHDVDSSEMAFKIAGSMAFKKAMEQARPVLLEPVLELEIVVDSDHMGDVMGDINGRRGKVLGMDSRGSKQVVRAEVPMSEALRYAVDLRAMTSGAGRFTQRFAHYQEVPPQIAEKVQGSAAHPAGDA